MTLDNLAGLSPLPGTYSILWSLIVVVDVGLINSPPDSADDADGQTRNSFRPVLLNF